MNARHAILITLLIGISGCTPEAPAEHNALESALERELSVMELMVTQIAPLTDTMWGIDDPQSDQEWQKFTDAAMATKAAFEQVKRGGSGVNDSNWVANSAWQAYADDVISAAEMYKGAIAARDMDAIFVAGDALYAPCEGCHIEFNPAVIVE